MSTCASAIAIHGLPYSTVLNTTGEADDPSAPDTDCGSGNSYNAAWRKIEASLGLPCAAVTIQDADDLSVVTVWKGPCGSLSITSEDCNVSSGGALNVTFDGSSDYFFEFTSQTPGGIAALSVDFTVPVCAGTFTALLGFGLTAALECATHQLTVTGSGFTTSTTLAVQDPNGDEVPYSVVSISPTTLIVELLSFVVNGNYTIIVDGTPSIVAALSCGSGPGNGWIVQPIRALRRFPLPFDANLLVFLWRLEVLIQSGVGTTAGDGSNSQLMLRLSKDGGKTWGNEHWRSMGQIGQYARRAYWNSNGQGRNWVCELVVSDPVFAGLIACYVDAQVGVS